MYQQACIHISKLKEVRSILKHLINLSRFLESILLVKISIWNMKGHVVNEMTWLHGFCYISLYLQFKPLTNLLKS